MIFVIVPLGKAAKEVLNWLIQVVVYIVASTVGGALVGLAMAALGTVVYMVVPGATAAWPVLVVGCWPCSMACTRPQLLRLPHPERGWQVPNAWIRRWPLRGTALFGLILGTGLFTFIPFTSYYVVLAWEAGTGSLLLGTALGAAYGLCGSARPRRRHTDAAEQAPPRLQHVAVGHITAWHRTTGALLLAVAGFLLGLLLQSL